MEKDRQSEEEKFLLVQDRLNFLASILATYANVLSDENLRDLDPATIFVSLQTELLQECKNKN